jgi:hypothetical protein
VAGDSKEPTTPPGDTLNMDPGYQPVHVFDGVPFIISLTMSKKTVKNFINKERNYNQIVRITNFMQNPQFIQSYYKNLFSGENYEKNRNYQCTNSVCDCSFGTF